MRISKIFSTRNILLFAFILVVLFLGTAFNVKVYHESFVEGVEETTEMKSAVAVANVKKMDAKKAEDKAKDAEDLAKYYAKEAKKADTKAVNSEADAVKADMLASNNPTDLLKTKAIHANSMATFNRNKATIALDFSKTKLAEAEVAKGKAEEAKAKAEEAVKLLWWR